MRRTVLFLLACLALSVASSGKLQADPITINTYDILDAAQIPFGNWNHSYSGTIVNTGSFSAHGFPYTRGNYSGGSGTLNDGLPGSNIFDTQLFANNNDSHPVITLNLNGFHTISGITLMSFDGGNQIPGNLGGFDVTINGNTFSFLSSEPTTNNEFVNLIGSPLDGLVTNQIVLSNFLHDGVDPTWNQMFAISEILVEGQSAVAVPVPSSVILFGIGTGLMALGSAYRRRRLLTA